MKQLEADPVYEVRGGIISGEEFVELFETWREGREKLIKERVDYVLELFEGADERDKELVSEAVAVATFAIELTVASFPKAALDTERVPILLVEELGKHSGGEFRYVKSPEGNIYALLVLGLEHLRKLAEKNESGKGIYDAEGMAEIVESTAEEFSHFVRAERAWKNEPEKIDKETKETLRLRKERGEIVERFETVMGEVEGFDKKNFFTRLVFGKKILDELGNKLRDVLNEERENMHDYQATSAELMGLIWKKQIGDWFLGWSKAHRRVVEDYERTIKNLREKRSIRREREDREEEEGLKRLWKDYEEFILENGEKLKIEERVRQAAEEAGVSLSEEQIQTAVEGISLYFFGNHLAMSKNPKVSERIKSWLVDIEIGEDCVIEEMAAVVWGYHEEEDGELHKVSPWQILNLAKWTTNDGGKRTVAKYISDRQVKVSVLAGIEEWAHMCFWEIKTLEQCLAANEQMSASILKFDELKDERLSRAGHHYYGSNVEFRGLLWQMAVIKEYLPITYSWLKSFRKKARGVKAGEKTTKVEVQ